MLIAVTDTAAIEDATYVAVGRRCVGKTRDTLMWRARTTPQLDATLATIARSEGRTRSEVIRDAVAEYARAHS